MSEQLANNSATPANPPPVTAIPDGHAKFDFYFKRAPVKDKDGKILKNADGEFVNELGQVIDKKPTIHVIAPVITFDQLISGLEDEKQKSYVLALLKDAVEGQLRDQINEGTPADKLDFSKLTLSYLANIPPAERRGGGIPKETWEAFAADYAEVMPAAAGKTPEQIANALKIILGKFQQIKTNKDVLAFFQTQIALYVESTKNGEEFQDCIEFLLNKLETFMQADNKALLNNL